MSQKEDKWKENFIQKSKIVKQNEDGNNFYEVYYFNYDAQKGSGVKGTVDVGVNVNIIDENLISKGTLGDHQDHQEHALKMHKKKPNYEIQAIT